MRPTVSVCLVGAAAAAAAATPNSGAGHRPSNLQPNDVTCSSPKIDGCFVDAADTRTFKFMAADQDHSLTQESCAALCYTASAKFQINYTRSAVEFGIQCFCGTEAELAAATESPAPQDCDALKCGGDAGESCGAPDRMLVFTADCSGDVPPQLPNGHAYGCQPGGVSADLPFCDSTKPVADRVVRSYNALFVHTYMLNSR